MQPSVWAALSPRLGEGWNKEKGKTCQEATMPAIGWNCSEMMQPPHHDGVNP